MSFFEWILVLSAAASAITLIAGALFFARRGIFGPISDIASVVLMALLALTAVYAYRLGEEGSFLLALAALLVGLGGILVAGVLQALLALGIVGYEPIFGAELMGGAAIGLWLIAGTVAIAMGHVVPPGLLYVGIASGIAYALPVAAHRLRGPEHPLFYVTSLLGVAGYVVWAIWLVQAI